jgi:hypothetical protein
MDLERGGVSAQGVVCLVIPLSIMITQPAFGESFDENFGPNEAPSDDPNEVANVDQMMLQVMIQMRLQMWIQMRFKMWIQMRLEVMIQMRIHVDQNEAPNDGDQPSMVVSSARYVTLANTSVQLSLDMISLPFMFCTAL